VQLIAEMSMCCEVISSFDIFAALLVKSTSSLETNHIFGFNEVELPRPIKHLPLRIRDVLSRAPQSSGPF